MAVLPCKSFASILSLGFDGTDLSISLCPGNLTAVHPYLELCTVAGTETSHPRLWVEMESRRKTPITKRGALGGIEKSSHFFLIT